ncbi:MAG: hypothetical protein JXB32_02830, partial [Deltaproteobacteria bacterium]|nr:hypothetical protein [Deltaproteobacteria bacterium]
RADLYAVGALLYECVTGRAPFEDPDPQRLAMRVLSDRLPRPIERNPSIPLGLDLAILRALAREREERYRTAGEMIRDLAPFVPARVRARLGLAEDEPTQIYEGSGRERRSLPPSGPATVVERRPRGFSWSAFAAAVSLVAVVATILWLRPWERGARDPAPATAVPAGAAAGAAAAEEGGKVAVLPAERDWVVISVTGLPPDAVALYDGAPVPSLPLVAKRSFGAVTFEVRAPGFESYKRLVVPDHDQQVDVALPPLGAAAGTPAGAPAGEPAASPPEPSEDSWPAGPDDRLDPPPPADPAPPPSALPVAAPPPPPPPAAPVTTRPAPRPASSSVRTAVPSAPEARSPVVEAPSPPPAAPTPASSGTRLSVISRPWSHITIDGRPTGRRTPLVGHELSAGVHRVCLETDDGRRHCAPVQLEPGQTTRLTHQF